MSLKEPKTDSGCPVLEAQSRPVAQVLVEILLWVLTRERRQQGNSNTPRGCGVSVPPKEDRGRKKPSSAFEM